MNFETGFTCWPGHYGKIPSQNALSLQVCDGALNPQPSFCIKGFQKFFLSLFKKKHWVSSVVVFFFFLVETPLTHTHTKSKYRKTPDQTA